MEKIRKFIFAVKFQHYRGTIFKLHLCVAFFMFSLSWKLNRYISIGILSLGLIFLAKIFLLKRKNIKTYKRIREFFKNIVYIIFLLVFCMVNYYFMIEKSSSEYFSKLWEKSMFVCIVISLIFLFWRHFKTDLTGPYKFSFVERIDTIRIGFSDNIRGFFVIVISQMTVFFILILFSFVIKLLGNMIGGTLISIVIIILLVCGYFFLVDLSKGPISGVDVNKIDVNFIGVNMLELSEKYIALEDNCLLNINQYSRIFKIDLTSALFDKIKINHLTITNYPSISKENHTGEFYLIVSEPKVFKKKLIRLQLDFTYLKDNQEFRNKVELFLVFKNINGELICSDIQTGHIRKWNKNSTSYVNRIICWLNEMNEKIRYLYVCKFGNSYKGFWNQNPSTVCLLSLNNYQIYNHNKVLEEKLFKSSDMHPIVWIAK